MRSSPKYERKELIRGTVIDEFREMLLLEPGENLDEGAALFDLGVGSLGLMTIKQAFEKSLEINIDASDFLSRPTISHLIDYLNSECLSSEEVVDGH